MYTLTESLRREIKDVQRRIEQSESRLATLSPKPAVVVELDKLKKLELELKTLEGKLN